MRNCPRCGRPLSQTEKVCPVCANAAPKKKKPYWIFIIAALLIVIVLMAVALYYVTLNLSDDDDRDRDEPSTEERQEDPEEPDEPGDPDDPDEPDVPEEPDEPEEPIVTPGEPEELLAEGPYDAGGFSITNGLRTYSSDDVIGIACVDVSAYQGLVDWNAVANAGVEAAIIRVGYRGWTAGGMVEDDYFRTNIEGALAAGLDVGVYFFSQAITEEEAIAEAEYTMRLIEDYPITYPVLYTWELMAEGRTAYTSIDKATDCAIAFCSAVEEVGYRSGVYFNTDWAEERYDLSRLSPYVSWGAWWYADQMPFPHDFGIWQYTETGNLSGIAGYVDLNIIFLNR